MQDGYGTDYSWGHKGTSTWWGDDKIKSQENRSAQLEKAQQQVGKVEFDLMKYWNDDNTRNEIEYTRATNDEVRAALWLSRIRFKLK